MSPKTSNRVLRWSVGISFLASGLSLWADIANKGSSVWFQSSGAIWIVISIIGIMINITTGNIDRSTSYNDAPMGGDMDSINAGFYSLVIYPTMAVIGTLISSYGWYFLNKLV